MLSDYKEWRASRTKNGANKEEIYEISENLEAPSSSESPTEVDQAAPVPPSTTTAPPEVQTQTATAAAAARAPEPAPPAPEPAPQTQVLDAVIDQAKADIDAVATALRQEAIRHDPEAVSTLITRCRRLAPDCCGKDIARVIHDEAPAAREGKIKPIAWLIKIVPKYFAGDWRARLPDKSPPLSEQEAKNRQMAVELYRKLEAKKKEQEEYARRKRPPGPL